MAGINSKTLAVSMYVSSQSADCKIFNSVFEILENGALSHTLGRLHLGDYY